MVLNYFKMKFIWLISSIVLLYLLSGCATMYFDNGKPNQDNVEQKTAWRHNVIEGFIELGDPVPLRKKCGYSEWSSVKTEFTPLNLLSFFGFELLLLHISSYSTLVHTAWWKSGIIFWYPLTAEVNCKS